MGKDAPSAPDPSKSAAAQTGTNVSTAVANAFLNNVGQNTPYGSLSYDQTGSYSWTDPSTGDTYDIPTFTANQTLTPAGQKLQDATMATQQNLANTAQSASGKLQQMLGRGINLNGGPRAGRVPTLDTVDVPRNWSDSDFSADRARVEKAIMDRAAGGLESDRQALTQSLADQGITIGSPAYQSAMSDYGRQVNDMRTSAILAGGEEQSRMAGLRSQSLADQISSTGFNNQTGIQQYSTQQDARNQYESRAYARRNQGLNEILSLMSGSQVQSPNFVNTAQNLIPTTDYAGIVQQGYQNQMGQFNAQNSFWNNVLGGAGALAML